MIQTILAQRSLVQAGGDVATLNTDATAIDTLLTSSGYKADKHSSETNYVKDNRVITVNASGHFVSKHKRDIPITGHGYNAFIRQHKLSNVLFSNTDINACGDMGTTSMMGEGTVLSKNDKNHPSKNHAAGHQACLDCGMSYKHSKSTSMYGSSGTVAHVYTHPKLQDHVEIAAKR